jgi:hypothetical protein
VQIPLLRGIVTDTNADFGTSLPVNLVPVPKQTGISNGYLRAAPGLSAIAEGPGQDRGGISWQGGCYRVMGSDLIRVDATSISHIGAVATPTNFAAMDYSTDRLCIVSGGEAVYLLQDGTIAPITDPDLGAPIDVIWVDNYFMFTDGTFIYVTDLNDPLSVDPTKYAASEIDPDAVMGLEKYRNEVHVFNRYTIEIFDNIGGSGFPFTRLPGGLIPKGCVGTHAKCLFAETLAWLGSGRNEANSVYVANGSSAVKVATREVEQRIGRYTDGELATVLVEAKADRLHQHLYVHLPGETLVYDAAASAAAGEPVWFVMSSGDSGINAYRGRGFVYLDGQWLVGDAQSRQVGRVDDSVTTQFGEMTGWQFDTMLLYNDSKGAQVHALELVGALGRGPVGETPTVFTSYTVDGLNWSQERQASMGARGNTQQRVVWRRQGHFFGFRGQRFRGANTTPVSWARLEAEIEPLA